MLRGKTSPSGLLDGGRRRSHLGYGWGPGLGWGIGVNNLAGLRLGKAKLAGHGINAAGLGKLRFG
jgi:hypothetical protein